MDFEIYGKQREYKVNRVKSASFMGVRYSVTGSYVRGSS